MSAHDLRMVIATRLFQPLRQRLPTPRAFARAELHGNKGARLTRRLLTASSLSVLLLARFGRSGPPRTAAHTQVGGVLGSWQGHRRAGGNWGWVGRVDRPNPRSSGPLLPFAGRPWPDGDPHRRPAEHTTGAAAGKAGLTSASAATLLSPPSPLRLRRWEEAAPSSEALAAGCAL